MVVVLLFLGLVVDLSAFGAEGNSAPRPAPLMSLMARFAAAEQACPLPSALPSLLPSPIKPSKPAKPEAALPQLVPAPDPLPGRGLAEHPLLYVGEWCRGLYVVNEGRVIWTYAPVDKGEYEDAWMLSNGNILFTRLRYVAEVTPEKQVLWRQDAPKGSEIATCQPLGLDRVLFVQNGKPPKLFVVNIQSGQVEVEREIPYDLSKGSVHTQFRRARLTPQGTYLIAYQMMDQVVEYDREFKAVWNYAVRSPCAVVRLKNGNTLITNEREVTILEVNPAKEVVWQLKPEELPELMRFTYAKSCTRLANGNTVVCTQVGRGNPPQLIEVTPDKKVVWMLRDWAHLGGATAVQILDDPGIPEIPGDSEH